MILHPADSCRSLRYKATSRNFGGGVLAEWMPKSRRLCQLQPRLHRYRGLALETRRSELELDSSALIGARNLAMCNKA